MLPKTSHLPNSWNKNLKCTKNREKLPIWNLLHPKLVQNNENCFTALKNFSEKVKENHIKELPIMYGSMEVGKKKKCKKLWILNFLKNVIMKKNPYNFGFKKKIKQWRKKKQPDSFGNFSFFNQKLDIN